MIPASVVRQNFDEVSGMFEEEGLNDDKLFALQLEYKCPVDWKKMSGDERIRFCGKCKQNVYNISKLTRDEAVSLINEKEGDLCVRFYQRKDGSVVTRDCMTILGPYATKFKFQPLALINSICSSIILSIMPMLGPALVTIQQGNGPIMADAVDSAARDSAEVTGSDTQK